MKLNYILTSAFLLITLLVALTSSISVMFTEDAFTESIAESYSYLTQNIMHEIDKEIYTKIEYFTLYSKKAIVQETLAQSNKEFDQLEDQQKYINQKDSEWISVPKKEITPFMSGLISNELSDDLRKILNFYNDKYNTVVFGEIFITNKYGANIAQTGKTSDYRQDDEEWWQNAKKDVIYVGDVNYDDSADIYSVDIIMRVDDNNGNFIGIMKIVYNIEQAISVIQEYYFEDLISIPNLELIDGKNRIIYSTESHAFLQKFPEEHFLKEISENRGYFVVDENVDNIELFSYAKSNGYKDFNGLGWTLILEYNLEELMQPVIKLKKLLSLISGLVVVVALIAGLILSKFISKPLKRISNDIDEISRGNLNMHLKKSNIDEVQLLINSLNRVLASMKLAILRVGMKKEDIVIGTDEVIKEKISEKDLLKAKLVRRLNNSNKIKKQKIKKSKINRIIR